MKTALLKAFGRPLEVEELPVPTPGPGQILIRVEACGVCHTDLHVARGHWPLFQTLMRLPIALGHEVAGQVAALGSGVARFLEGQAVGVAWFHRTCGECRYCRRDLEVFCEQADVTGITVPGGFSQYLLAWEDHALPLPAGLSPLQAAPLFCAGGTVYSALRKAELSGASLGVWGVGGLGHLAVQLGRLAGARVTAVDLFPAQLDLARKAGAEHGLTVAEAAGWFARKENLLDVALVCAPAVESYRAAFSSLRKNGTLLVVGLPSEPLQFGAGELVRSGVRIIPSRVSSRAELQELLDLAGQGLLKIESFAYRLETINEVLDLLEKGKIAGRAVLDLGEPTSRGN